MGKLIDSDWLKEQWAEPTDWMDGDQVLHHYTWFKMVLELAPTVDAVPVQRCKDRIIQEIDELKENGERHSDEVRQNGLLIAEGLRVALRIVEEIFLKDGEQE